MKKENDFVFEKTQQQQKQQQQHTAPAASTAVIIPSTTSRRRKSSSSSSSSRLMRDTWNDFNRALRNVRQPFNPFVWIYRLVVAVIHHVYVTTGCAHVVVRHRLVQKWRAGIPIFALCLILLVLISYPLSIRLGILQPRWCTVAQVATTANSEKENYDDSNNESSSSCAWLYLHDGIVLYLGIMILFHYYMAIFTSPGVVLAADTAGGGDDESTSSDEVTSWTALQGQGGVLGWNATCHPERERQRVVALYGGPTMSPPSPSLVVGAASNNNKQNQKKNTNTKDDDDGIIHYYFPSIEPTFCETCQVHRPPRCHHCRACQRCVLQYDHHCIWVNQCIGYNNYRHFVLLLMFLVLGCAYGVVMLFWPFYEPLRAQVREHGWHWLYSNGTGFLNLPTPRVMWDMMWHGDDDGLPAHMVVDLVYPLLMGVGAVLGGFFAFHVQYVLKARTTLEHKIDLQNALAEIYRQQQEVQQQHDSSTISTTTTTTTTTTTVSNTTINPFDQGYYKNLQQILGHNLLWIFVPIPITLPPPYLPDKKKKKKDT